VRCESEKFPGIDEQSGGPRVLALLQLEQELLSRNSAGVSGQLTPREADVLALARDGAPVNEIAKRVSLSRGTVRNYLTASIAKLGAANRHEAARIAAEHGWI
jgi:two-component system response regulator DesR